MNHTLPPTAKGVNQALPSIVNSGCTDTDSTILLNGVLDSFVMFSLCNNCVLIDLLKHTESTHSDHLSLQSAVEALKNVMT